MDARLISNLNELHAKYVTSSDVKRLFDADGVIGAEM